MRKYLAALVAALISIISSLFLAAPTVRADETSCLKGSSGNTLAPFYRETTRYGHRDMDVYNIQHVRELQYRLKRAGLFADYPVTGNFLDYTKSEVKKFQRRHDLCATGASNQATWQVLIQKTTKGLKRVPDSCKGLGWWVCYDRTHHQLFAFKNGRLHNVWLVRGGAQVCKTDGVQHACETRTGTFRVFASYEYKVSSLYDSGMYHFRKFNGGQGFHGSILMMDPFVGHSHGCINMYLEDAKVLWDLTLGVNPRISVYGAWS